VSYGLPWMEFRYESRLASVPKTWLSILTRLRRRRGEIWRLCALALWATMIRTLQPSPALQFWAVFPAPSDAAECDYLSPCRCPVDLLKFNPLYPRSLHRTLYHKDKTCGHGKL